ncbi:MAG TPA: DUF4097 family beta strand repeat-containing protein [Opitutaceae bacterium]
MKIVSLALTASLTFGLAATAQAKFERTIEKTFSVQPGGTLTVATQGGDIRVEPGSGNEVKVVARQVFPRADSDAEADEVLKDVEFELTQTGNDVSAIVRSEKKGGMGWFGGGWPPVRVHFTVTVPSRYQVDLKTSGGDVRVGNLTGKAQVRTSGGDVRLGRIDGVVDAGTSGGDVTLAEGTAEVKLKTSGGDIEVGRVAGQATLTTSGGNIRVNAAGNALDATTSGGDVTVAFTGLVTGEVNLKTSGGDITARLAKDSAVSLDAKTSGGAVKAAGVTITIKEGGVGKNHLVGDVNGGGPALKLRTSGGDVTVAVR